MKLLEPVRWMLTLCLFSSVWCGGVGFPWRRLSSLLEHTQSTLLLSKCLQSSPTLLQLTNYHKFTFFHWQELHFKGSVSFQLTPSDSLQSNFPTRAIIWAHREEGGLELIVALCFFSDGWAGGVHWASACLVGMRGRIEAWHEIMIGIYGSGWAGEKFVKLV